MAAALGYTRLQLGLHWAIAGLILGNYVLSDAMPGLFDRMIEAGAQGGSLAGGGLHVWIGLAVLVLVLVRLPVRLISGAPAAPAGTPPLLDRAGRYGHLALYVLMLLVPMLGALAWFQGIEQLGDVHVLAMNALMLLALAHAGAAIYHQYVRRDGLLVRMMRAR